MKLNVLDFFTNAPIPDASVRRLKVFSWCTVESDGSVIIPGEHLVPCDGTCLVEVTCAGYFEGLLEVRDPEGEQTISLHPLSRYMPPWWSKFYSLPAAPIIGSTLRVGIIDSGCAEHELLSRVKRYGIDDSGITAQCVPENQIDRVGHGTHIAGLIGGQPNVAPVFAGILPNADILSVRIIDTMESEKNQAMQSRLELALTFLTQQRVDIINLSLKTQEPSEVFFNAINDTLDAGVVLVAAAGNSGLTYPEFPACHPDVIAISAFGHLFRTPQDTLSYIRSERLIDEATSNAVDLFRYVDSNRGRKNFWCPGVAAISTFPRDVALPSDGFKELDGTSFACAIATGLIGSTVMAQKTTLDTLAGRAKVTAIINAVEQNSQMLGEPAFRVLF